MDELIIVLVLLGLVVVGLGFALPIVAISVASSASRRATQLAAQVAHLQGWVRWHEQRLQGLARGVEARDRPAPATDVVTPADHTPAAAPVPPPPPPVPAAIPAPTPAFAGYGPYTPAPGRPFDWDSVIGVRLFAWLGGFALFVGAALFLQYSIQHNLIPPPVRVAIGLCAGAAALAGGDAVRRKADRAGQALSGAGVAILYASIYAARSLYELVSTPLAFVAMVAVTVVAGLLAHRRSSLMLAILALAGGFLTPYLLSSHENHALVLLGYVALLDAGVIVVSRSRAWPVLTALGVAGTALVFAAWAWTFLDALQLPYALGASALLAGPFVLLHVRTKGGDSPLGRGLARAVAASAAVLPFVLALVASGASSLDVSPAVLVVDLVLLCGLALAASMRSRAPALLVFAALLSMVALAARAGDDLFPARRGLTLALFALVPAALFAGWLVLRARAAARPDGAVLAAHARAAAALALGGTLAVTARVVLTEAAGEPIAPLCVFGAVAAAGLVATGALSARGGSVAFGLAYALLSLLALASRFTDARLVEFVVPIAASGLAFALLPLAHARLRSTHAAWVSSAVSLPLHFALLYALARGPLGEQASGAIALGCAAVSLGLVVLAQRTAGERADLPGLADAAHAASAVAMVTVAIPILASKEWITIGWALEATALAALSLRTRYGWLRWAGAVLGLAVVARLVLNPAVFGYHPRPLSPIVNYYLAAFGVPALSLLASGALLARGAEDGVRRGLALAHRIAAGVLLFVLINVEIADLYSTGPELSFGLVGGSLAQDMTYSLAWGVYALGLLTVGIVRASRGMRIGAVAVLCVTVAKVALHDLWSLGALYRVGSIVGLAVALLVVSFVTQRFLLKRR